MAKPNPFTRRARPHQMLKRERQRLRKLASSFIERLAGVQNVTTLTGTVIEGDYELKTACGRLRVTLYDGWIACRFEDVQKARNVLGADRTSRLNPHSGKWNFCFGRMTAADAFRQFVVELYDLVVWWERHDLSCCGHEVLIDQRHGERGDEWYALLLNGRPVQSDHANYLAMLKGAVENGQAAALLDWLQESTPKEWEAAQPQPARFTVVKSRTRTYGYAIQAPANVTWSKGPDNTFGWYRRKRDAQAQADLHNRQGSPP